MIGGVISSWSWGIYRTEEEIYNAILYENLNLSLIDCFKFLAKNHKGVKCLNDTFKKAGIKLEVSAILD